MNCFFLAESEINYSKSLFRGSQNKLYNLLTMLIITRILHIKYPNDKCNSSCKNLQEIDDSSDCRLYTKFSQPSTLEMFSTYMCNSLPLALLAKLIRFESQNIWTVPNCLSLGHIFWEALDWTLDLSSFSFCPFSFRADGLGTWYFI